MDPKEVKKDLLPYIFVICDPKVGNKLLLGASDISLRGVICKWTFADLTKPWVSGVIRVFEKFVNPQTLKALEDGANELVTLVRAGRGTVWIKSDGIGMVCP